VYAENALAVVLPGTAREVIKRFQHTIVGHPPAGVYLSITGLYVLNYVIIAATDFTRAGNLRIDPAGSVQGPSATSERAVGTVTCHVIRQTTTVRSQCIIQ
jgi:hypothetical protein